MDARVGDLIEDSLGEDVLLILPILRPSLLLKLGNLVMGGVDDMEALVEAAATPLTPPVM